MVEDKKYPKGSIGWLREQAKKDGFDDISKWNKWKKEQRKYKELSNKYGEEFANWVKNDPDKNTNKNKDYRNKKYQSISKQKWEDDIKNKYGEEFARWAIQNKDKIPRYILSAGCKNIKEWKDKIKQRLGYKDYNDWQREWRHDTGRQLSMSDNEYCSSNFGIHKGERIFKKFLEEVVFEDVNGSGKGSYDGGIDFICKNPRQEFIDKYPQFKLERDKECNIQLEVRCMRQVDNGYNGWFGWTFTHIDYNNKVDFFILCGFDNRKESNPSYILMFHKDDIVRDRKFWRRTGISITNSPQSLKEFKRYELTDELEKLKEICDELK